MGRVWDWLKDAGARLKKFAAGRQGKAFTRILQFFALMLVLTIFARGATAVTMPVVETAAPSQQNIRVADDYSGTITATNKTDVKLPAGLTVDKIHVSSGSSVRVGDALVSFDVDTINDSLTEQQIALQQLRLELAELQKDTEQDDSSVEAAQEMADQAAKQVETAKKAVTAAQAAYNSAATAADAAVAAAQVKHDQAVPFITSLAADVADKLNIYNTALAELNADPGDPDKFAAAEAAKTAYETALSDLAPYQADVDGLAAAQAQRTADLAAAQAEIDAAKASQTTAEQALADANEALADAKEQFSESKPSYDLEQQKKKLQIRAKQQEIAEQQKTVDSLAALAGTDATVKATVDGTVSEINAVQGGVTTAENYIRISTGVEGYLAEFSVSNEKAREISIGASVSVKYSNYYWGSEARVVSKSIPGEGGMVTVRAQLQNTDWRDGDSVTVTVVLNDRTYWSCVPLAAVRPDSTGQYILVLFEESTILGTQTVARKVAVTVTDKDNTYAAIEPTEGYLDQTARIIIGSSKPVSDGDMVRLDEESTK